MSSERKKTLSSGLSGRKSSSKITLFLESECVESTRFSMPAFLKEKSDKPWIAVPVSKSKVAFYQKNGIKIFIIDLDSKKLDSLSIGNDPELKQESKPSPIEKVFARSGKIIAVANDEIATWSVDDLKLIGRPLISPFLAEAKKHRLNVTPDGQRIIWLKENFYPRHGNVTELVVVDTVLGKPRGVFLSDSGILDVSEISFKTKFCVSTNEVYLTSNFNINNRCVSVVDIKVEGDNLIIRKNPEKTTDLLGIAQEVGEPYFNLVLGIWKQPNGSMILAMKKIMVMDREKSGLYFYSLSDRKFTQIAHFGETEIYEDCFNVEMFEPGVYIAKTNERDHNCILDLNNYRVYLIPRSFVFSPDGYMFNITSESIVRHTYLSLMVRLEKMKAGYINQVGETLMNVGSLPAALTRLVGSFFSPSDYLLQGMSNNISLSNRLPEKMRKEFLKEYETLFAAYKKSKDAVQYAKLYILLEVNQMLNDFSRLSGDEIVSLILRQYSNIQEDKILKSIRGIPVVMEDIALQKNKAKRA